MGHYTKLLRLGKNELKLTSKDNLLKYFLDERPNGIEALDIDKSVEGILYYLSEWPLLQETEFIYEKLDVRCNKNLSLFEDPAWKVWVIEPSEVQELNSLLFTYSEGNLQNNFDPEGMTARQIYPQIWDREDAYNYLSAHFLSLKSFIAKAAQLSQIIVITTN